MSEQEEQRTIWDINPLDTKVELTDGKIRMQERALYNGRLRVSQAVNVSTGPTECAWLYLQAESRDGADVKLTVDQAKELRDALDKCINRADSDASRTESGDN